MYTHSYRKKRTKQFLDFIKQINQKYNSNVKQIFLVLGTVLPFTDCRKVQETDPKNIIQEYIQLLPTRALELPQIEVRWMWMQRQAVNNSTI